jgi:hypothetical protein
MLNVKKILLLFCLTQFLSSCIEEGLGPNSNPLGPKPTLTIASPRLALQKPNFDWRQELVYFVLVDRFYDGDSSNNKASGTDSNIPFQESLKNFDALKTYQGGDLEGVYQKLEYIKNLGATTIWLSPVYQNSNKPYKGYWPLPWLSPK